MASVTLAVSVTSCAVMRPLMALAGTALACGLMLAVPGVARGAAASARLAYVRGPGAEQCPDEQAVRAAVSSRLGYDPFFAWAQDTLFAKITRAGDTFRAEITFVDAQNMQRGARDISIKSDDCAAVIDAMGLTISLTIDPSNLGPSSSPPSSPPRPETHPPSVEGETPATIAPPSAHAQALPATVRRPAEPGFGHMGLGAIGSIGTAPAVAVGATLFIGVSWRAMSFDLEGRADLPANGNDDQGTARVRSSLIVGSVVPCLHVGAAFGCPMMSVGSLSATSEGVAAPRTENATWWGAGVRAGAEVALAEALFFRAYLDLLATLTPYTLSIDHAVVYTFSPWSGSLGAAMAWRFP